jgi:hypothetical protein
MEQVDVKLKHSFEIDTPAVVMGVATDTVESYKFNYSQQNLILRYPVYLQE